MPVSSQSATVRASASIGLVRHVTHPAPREIAHRLNLRRVAKCPDSVAERWEIPSCGGVPFAMV
jgi:hypothetical protein